MSIAEISKPEADYCGLWNVSAAEYHAALEIWGRSMVGDFRDSPRLAHETFVLRTRPPKESTPDMKFGTLLHLFLLEPLRYATDCVEVPPLGPCGEKWDRRKKDHKLAWEDFESEAGGRLLVSAEDSELLKNMRRGVERNKDAADLLFGEGPTEQAIRWVDEDTGLPCKSLRDKMARKGTVIVDPKSTIDISPEGFARTVLKFGYHNQDAWYRDGHALTFGEDCEGMVFVAMSKAAPFDVACYTLDYDAIELGRRQNRKALDDIARCFETGDWSAPYERQVSELSLPNYAFYSNQYEV